MFTIKKLKIKGFRGYMDEKEFAFNNPITIFSGENHRGKSSTLNAIEWCFFGNECAGKNTGIRERIDWEISNRNLSSGTGVYVKVELEDENKISYEIERKWISARKNELKISTEDKKLHGDKAEEKLRQLLRLSFQDFLTSAYQHQEAVRAILTQEPSEKNEAIDRLLGLSVYRNILTGIEAAKISSKQKEMDNELDNFRNRITAIIDTHSRNLDDKKKQAGEKGLKEEQLNEKGVLEIAMLVKKQLGRFASESGLVLAELGVPAQRKGISLFQKDAEDEIKRLRSEMPDVQMQNKLFESRSKLMQSKTEYDSRVDSLKAMDRDLEIFSKEIGKEDDLNNSKSQILKKISGNEKEMSEANAKSLIISKAMKYLRLDGVNKNICPVCSKETDDLLKHLEREWKEKYETQVGKIQDEINKLICDLKNTESSLNKYREYKDKRENINNGLNEANKNISELLGRAISERDDLSVLINNEMKRIEEKLKELEQSVKSKQEILDKIVALLEQIRIVNDILNYEEKKKIVEQIKQSDEFKQMELLKDKMAILANDIDKIKEAINAASNEEAKGKIGLAGNIIDNFFRKITNNPMVIKVNLHVSVDSKGKNNYEFKDQNDNEITPILSQGDLNALALSIFLGMAYLKGAEQSCGFIMMDDPSQSLGSGHKEKFAEVIEEVLNSRMVILSTMDKELRDLTLSKITKAKTQYVFEGWTPQGGPEIRMG